MSYKIKILIVEDEEQPLLALKTIISKSFPDIEIDIARNGKEALEKSFVFEPNIIISDIAMPIMDGIALLKKIREDSHFKDTYFIIITAVTEKNLKVEALEAGSDDFLNKPFMIEELKSRINSAVRIVKMNHELIEENKKLNILTHEQDQHIHNITQLAIKFMQARVPASAESLKRIVDSSVWIANEMKNVGDFDINDIEMAASLCYCGKIYLPDAAIKTPVLTNGIPTSSLMYQVPITSRDILSGVKKFEGAAKILYHLYENFDGSGIPERLQTWQIPIGSRIIRVAMDFEEILNSTHYNNKSVFDILEREAKRLYDHRMVTLFGQFLSISGLYDSRIEQKALKIYELEEGMILARDLIANSGLKLLSAGAIFRKDIIEKITNINTSDPVLGYVIVKR